MNKSKFLFPLLTSIIAGLLVAVFAMAFTGPGTRSPGTGNPDYWIKSGNDVYYNVIGGNVGIGTVGPAYKLDVQGGQINSSGGLCIAADCKTAWSQVQGTNYWTLSSSSLYPISTSYNLGVGTASLDSNYKITTAGGGIKAESTSQPAGYFSSASGYGLIVNSGNVGIGTTNPGAPLEVAVDQSRTSYTGTSKGLLHLNAGETDEDLTTITLGEYVNYPISIIGVRYDTALGSSLFFGTSNNYEAGITNTAMTINPSGNVGIGTASPGATLEVAGQIKITGGTPGANKVLTSNDVGLANWQAPSSLPSGAIIMYSGAWNFDGTGLGTGALTGWALSNGNNGTPNLSDRFVMGTITSPTPGATGGANSYSLTVAELPAHSHSISSDGAHEHSAKRSGGSGGWDTVLDALTGQREIYWTSGLVSSAGAHSHGGSTGAVGSGSLIDNRPAFIRLAFIMKL